ncbi:MAG: alpha/beta fold hydrolase [Chitinophagales bacterium]
MNEVQRPSTLLFATDIGRGLIGLANYFASIPIFNMAAKGDGHPVLVLPGFGATDVSTHPLRYFLKKQNFTPYAWELGRNLGGVDFLEDIIVRVQEIAHQHGQKISLVGWSLGGVFAREVARRHPGIVRQVITLGSPFQHVGHGNNIKWIYEFVTQNEIEGIDPQLIEDMKYPPPVPSTAIYTKGDGIVSWKCCIEMIEDHQTQNVEVSGSHCGLGHNPVALFCIADRLSQRDGYWRKFKPSFLQQQLHRDLKLHIG